MPLTCVHFKGNGACSMMRKLKVKKWIKDMFFFPD